MVTTQEKPEADERRGKRMGSTERMRLRACLSCRRRKVRCRPHPYDGSGPCERCLDSGNQCIYTAPPRTKRKRADVRVRELEREVADSKRPAQTYPRGHIECLERKHQELIQDYRKASEYFQALSAGILLQVVHDQEELRTPEIELQRTPEKENNSGCSDYKLPIPLHQRAFDYEYDRAIPPYLGRTSTCSQNEECETFRHLQEHYAFFNFRIGTTSDAAAWCLDGVKLTSPSNVGDCKWQGLFGLGSKTYQQLYNCTKAFDPISYPNARKSIMTAFESSSGSNSTHRDPDDDACLRLLSSVLHGKVEEELQDPTNEWLKPGHVHGISPGRSLLGYLLGYGAEDNALSKTMQAKGTSLSMTDWFNKEELFSNSRRERGLGGFNSFRKPGLVLGSSLLTYGLPLVAAAFNHWDALRVASGVASMGTGVAVIPLQQVEGVPETAWLWTFGAWAGCFMPYLWLKTREIPKQLLYRRKFYVFCVILASVHFIIGMSQGLEGAGSGFALYGPIVLTTCAYLVSFVFVPHGASDRDIVATGLEYLGVSPGTNRALNSVSAPNSSPAER